MPHEPEPYAAISRLYDQDVHLEVPAAFFRAIAPLCRRASAGTAAGPGRAAPPVLDLGCGSGLLSEAIAASGARVLGIDASPAMLAIARRRCAAHGRRARFRAARFLDLRLPPVHRLAVACHDVLNHVPRAQLLTATFAALRGTLGPGGMLVFDSVTEATYETLWTDNTHRLQGPHGDLWMECDWDAAARRATVHMVGYLRRADGRFSRHETTLHEYAWSDDDFTAALRRAGFAEVWRKPWSAFGERRERDRERRLWCARQAGGPAADTRLLRRLGFRRARTTVS